MIIDEYPDAIISVLHASLEAKNPLFCKFRQDNAGSSSLQSDKVLRKVTISVLLEGCTH